MARPKTAQPNHSLRKVAAVVATAVSGMSVYAQAAEQPKQEETITVVAAPAAQESAWGPAPTIAAKRSATATKTDTPIEKTPQSVSVVTRQEMEMRQPTTVKEALSYTPSVFSTRGSSTTYDVVTIRGFTTSTTVNTNQYLDGMKLQGNNYSEVSRACGSDARANLGAVRQQQPGRYRQHGQQAPDYRAAERSAV